MRLVLHDQNVKTLPFTGPNFPLLTALSHIPHGRWNAFFWGQNHSENTGKNSKFWSKHFSCFWGQISPWSSWVSSNQVCKPYTRPQGKGLEINLCVSNSPQRTRNLPLSSWRSTQTSLTWGKLHFSCFLSYSFVISCPGWNIPAYLVLPWVKATSFL